MEMAGEYRIPAPRETVWDALNDPEVLKEALPGCEELEKEGDNAFTAKVRAKVGPVSARFSGKVNLLNMQPPESYRIEGEGTGGAAGFAKGGADVHLAEDGAETILTYSANASVGGKLAQIGSRLVQGTARKMADDFFANFTRIVSERAGTGDAATADAATAEPGANAGASTVGAQQVPETDPGVSQQRPIQPDLNTSPQATPAPSPATVSSAAPEPQGRDAPSGLPEPEKSGIPQWAWIAGGAAALLVLLYVLV